MLVKNDGLPIEAPSRCGFIFEIQIPNIIFVSKAALIPILNESQLWITPRGGGLIGVLKWFPNNDCLSEFFILYFTLPILSTIMLNHMQEWMY